MKTILVKFKNSNTIYTYNTDENIKNGDVLNVDYLGTECKVCDVIENSKFKYISKETGELKEGRNNVRDITIKKLLTKRIEVIQKFFMGEDK